MSVERANAGSRETEAARAQLGAAADRLRDRCLTGPVEVPEPILLQEEIAHVAALVDALISGAPLPDLPAAAADRAGIVDALRAHALESWPERDDASLLVGMRALEAARAEMVGRPIVPLAPGVLTPYGHRLLREVAHTLRSPLGSVVMLAASLRDGMSGEVSDLQRKHLGIVHRAALSIATMANDLLGLTGDEDGLDGEPQSLRVDEIVGQTVGVIAAVAEERRVVLDVREGPADVRSGRPAALGRVLTNLALNGVLLVRDGELSIEARAQEGDQVEFIVVAHPVPDDADALLRPFEAPGAEQEYTLSRSGLGFATARHLVRRLGSELTASNDGDGRLDLRFSLRLPPQV